MLCLQVVTKKKLDMASQEKYHEKLSEKFDKIERERKSKEAAAAAAKGEEVIGRLLDLPEKFSESSNH